VAERAREAVPEPVLEVVHEAEEAGREERRGNAGRRTEADEPKIGDEAEGRIHGRRSSDADDATARPSREDRDVAASAISKGDT